MRHIAVIDIGKTNAKLALVDRESLREVAVVTRPNAVLGGPPWPHFDVEGHWAFLLDGLARFHAGHGIGEISVTTHGASAALIGVDGALAAPILDYEHDGPDSAAGEYEAIRPPFEETGSPRLGMGLNLGAQLYWQFSLDPELKERVRHIVTYPQYWGYRLTGVAATDVTSLGCHTDLWDPQRCRLSSLADALGIADLVAPIHRPGEVLGTIRAEVAERTGLAPGTPVRCGIHDSNASLLPHLRDRAAPFSVVSTGTWVVAMAVGGAQVSLDAGRDTLINTNAFGDPVPSARFMGGREFELILGGETGGPAPSDMELSSVLSEGVMLLPSVEPRSGPFQGKAAVWVGNEPAKGSAAREIAASFYLALMTAECLDLIGAEGPILVEGPFSRNAAYLHMLASVLGRDVHPLEGATGTSQGAALLSLGDEESGPTAPLPAAAKGSAAAENYARRWRDLVRETGA